MIHEEVLYQVYAPVHFTNTITTNTFALLFFSCIFLEITSFMSGPHKSSSQQCCSKSFLVSVFQFDGILIS